MSVACECAADRPDLTASMEEITELFDYEKIANTVFATLDDPLA